MLALLEDQLDAKALPYQFELKEQQASDHVILGHLQLGRQGNKNIADVDISSIHLLFRSQLRFEDEQNQRQYDLAEHSIFMRASALGQMLSSAAAVVTFEGDQTPESWLVAGYQAQILTNAWYDQSLASCTLGFPLYANVTYTIALGGMRKQDMALPEIQREPLALEAYISQCISNHLPQYMVPSVYLKLDTLPLTPNGKVDYKALPKVDMQQNESYVAPTNDNERIITSILAEVLGLDRVGINDHFFRIGGNSLSATSAISRIQDALDIEVKVRDLFSMPIVKEFCEQIFAKQGECKGQLLQLQHTDRDAEEFVLSYAEQRLWFLAYYQGQQNTYNMFYPYLIEGEVDSQALVQSCYRLIERHTNLRSIYPDDHGKPYKALLSIDQCKAVIQIKKINQQDLPDALKKDGLYLFDMASGPLFFMHLYQLPDSKFVLAVNVHHILADAWSMEMLLHELSIYYAHLSDGIDLPLEQTQALQYEYIDFASSQQTWLEKNEIQEQLTFWTEKLNEFELLNLPTDFERPTVETMQGDAYQFMLSADLLKQINHFIDQQDVTLFMFINRCPFGKAV